jgi:osmotically-inducible protein OsmY
MFRSTHCRRKAFSVWIALAMLAWMLTGCTAVVIEGAKRAWEDRSAEDQVLDIQIAAGLMSALAKKDNNLFLDVSFDVWEQRVMVTGALSDPRQKQDVDHMVRADRRMRTIYHDILLVSAESQAQRRDASRNKAAPKKEGVGQTVNDFWIETKISAQLLTKENVTSVNYRWRSVYNTVYVIGRAPSRTELNAVLAVIRDTEGVKNTRSYIEIKPGRVHN